MKLLLLVGSILALAVAPAEAGRRYYRSYSSCYSRPAYYAPSYVAAPVYVAPKVGWRSAMTTILSQREENRAFDNAMYALTGTAQPVLNGAQGYNSTGYGQMHTQYAPQGQTVYGQQASFASLNVGALYDKSERLTAQAQQLAGQANTDFAELVNVAASGNARAAEIIARGQAAAAAIAATAAGQPQPLSRTFSFQITQTADGQTTVVPQDGVGQQPVVGPGPTTGDDQPLSRQEIAYNQVLSQRCVSCHGESSPKGDLDLGKSLEALQAEPAALNDLWSNIVEHVTNPDPNKRMPLAIGGGPGEPLSPAEIQILQSARVEVSQGLANN
jgi:hypothetical protein